MKAQTWYVIPGLKNLFNANNSRLCYADLLNDSIKSALFQIDETHFIVRFYINDEFECQGKCVLTGKEETMNSTILRNVNGKQKATESIFKIKYIEPIDKAILSFLPSSLYNK